MLSNPWFSYWSTSHMPLHTSILTCCMTHQIQSIRNRAARVIYGRRNDVSTILSKNYTSSLWKDISILKSCCFGPQMCSQCCFLVNTWHTLHEFFLAQLPRYLSYHGYVPRLVYIELLHILWTECPLSIDNLEFHTSPTVHILFEQYWIL